jgi:hypothetical protein
MSAADVFQVDLPRDADAQLGGAAAIGVEVARLDHHHVAAVAAAAVEEAARRCRGRDGRHHLEKRVADGHDGVHEAELGDPGVVEADADAEHRGEIGDGLVEVARGDDDLSEPHHDVPSSVIGTPGSSMPRSRCVELVGAGARRPPARGAEHLAGLGAPPAVGEHGHLREAGLVPAVPPGVLPSRTRAQ